MPTSFHNLLTDWQQRYSVYTEAYTSGQQSFIPNLLPQTAVQFPVYQTLEILHKRLGTDRLRRALDPSETIASPVADQPDGTWLKRSNMVGVNVRTIGSFWNVVNYVFTLPAGHDSIHLLPIWEPGVVGSLYGMVSWQINPEFFSVELAQAVPALNTVEKQLKIVVNLLHTMGRTVGMDVIPHTDRFSEIVLACPSLFEWVQREGATMTSHSATLYRQVEGAIWQYLKFYGAADGTPLTFAKDFFFSQDISILTDEQRTRILFGHPNDYGGRLSRRLELIRYLTAQGFETLPMTMAPPYRGLHIDPTDYVLDDFGQIWYQYAFDKPETMSRVFGPLARYRFYEPENDNQQWALDFDRPNHPAWDYVCHKYHDCQRAYNFDFMRGDMAHVQMRPEGVPLTPGPFYDPLRAIKQYVRQHGTPHYAFFAETFLAPPDTMGYGDELDHLEAIEADSTLGDLQSTVIGSPLFVDRFQTYYHWLKTRQFAPNFTVMTADKDDPRFDEFYRTGNLFRYFTALFLTDMPSYVGLGFEVRNLHEQRGANEEYTKLYVFRIEDDRQPDKVTHGPFEWGQNADQFVIIQRMRQLAEQIWPQITGKRTQWLVAPGEADYVVWTHEETSGYVFAAAMTGALPDTLPGELASNRLFDEAQCRIYQTVF
ncbi:hypothetical protein BN8_04694 [Fibrisoma limi BUZ 3]|uniref:Uncharacterized protein n=1 Tax=Fibrisoma limi BUZ 3 TaxID=1185876 RepID=I2GNF7_9BACT|nr:hypothetical protein [Fibrisoma limi]CCH55435.1 hypothetical protein BN8_04694 [Fibrisoma limi BUZ 3]